MLIKETMMWRFSLVLLWASLALPAQATLNILATVPEWGALAQVLGGEQVKVYTATTAFQDPHRIEARPSLMAQARRADLVVAVGADLEVAWLPVLLRESGNPAIQPGQPGYFEAAAQVDRLERPASLDRAQGDVHPAGNPHIHLDPRNVLRVAQALGQQLARLDPAHAAAYQARLARFSQEWTAAMVRWAEQAAPLRGVGVVVHHRAFVYLEHWLGLIERGALEPKPGIEPSASHLAGLLAQQAKAPAALVLRAPYQPAGPSEWLAGKAGISAVLLPYTVGGTPAAADLFGLFDDTLARLRQGLR
jgi:zinc/manganese transport system substrate-binding protein